MLSISDVHPLSEFQRCCSNYLEDLSEKIIDQGAIAILFES